MRLKFDDWSNESEYTWEVVHNEWGDKILLTFFVFLTFFYIFAKINNSKWLLTIEKTIRLWKEKLQSF